MMWVLAVSFDYTVFNHPMGQDVAALARGKQLGLQTDSGSAFDGHCHGLSEGCAGQILAQMAASSEAISQYAVVVSHSLPV